MPPRSARRPRRRRPRRADRSVDRTAAPSPGRWCAERPPPWRPDARPGRRRPPRRPPCRRPRRRRGARAGRTTASARGWCGRVGIAPDGSRSSPPGPRARSADSRTRTPWPSSTPDSRAAARPRRVPRRRTRRPTGRRPIRWPSGGNTALGPSRDSDQLEGGAHSREQGPPIVAASTAVAPARPSPMSTAEPKAYVIRKSRRQHSSAARVLERKNAAV